MSLHGLTTTAVQADLGHDPHDTILWIPGVLHAGKQALNKLVNKLQLGNEQSMTMQTVTCASLVCQGAATAELPLLSPANLTVSCP